MTGRHTDGPKFKSSYAILDVGKGRKGLEKHLRKHGPLTVLIRAQIRDPYGSDDGCSIEFNCDVISVEVQP